MFILTRTSPEDKIYQEKLKLIKITIHFKNILKKRRIFKKMTVCSIMNIEIILLLKMVKDAGQQFGGSLMNH